MNKKIIEIFEDNVIVAKIMKRLPYMFQLAELESSRAGHVGMEVGSLREKILISLLIYKFGEENINTEIPITKSEIDVEVFNEPLSIKTITGKSVTGVKLSWTVDSQTSHDFLKSYYPTYDILFVQINWEDTGYFYYIPFEVQQKIFDKVGRNDYIKLPKEGTNPRGIEIKKDVLVNILQQSETRKIEIFWEKKEIEANPYLRWVDLWRES